MPAAAKVAPAKLAPKPAMKPATKPAAPKLVPAKPAAAKPHMPAPIQKLAAGSQPHAAPAAALPAFARLAAPSPATKPHLPVAHAPLTHTKSAAPTMPPLIRATLPATPQAEPYPVAPHLLPHPHKAQTRHPEPSHHASVHPSTHPKARPRLLPLTPRTHTLGSGQPLAAHIQNAIEHSLHVDLSSVRVHHDHAAQAKAMQLSARAFTYGHDIFLGSGEHPHDLPLLAHEAAHVVQQQAAASPQAWSTGSTFASNNHFEHEAVQASSAVQRGESFNVQQRVSTPSVQRLGISDALDYFAGAANNLPGFSMLTVVIGFNPINMANVERSPANILRAVVEFIPGGHQVTAALNKYGVFEKVGNWIADQLKTLGDIGHALHVALDKFLDSLSWKDIFHLGDLWDRFVSTFTAPIDRIKSFLGGLVTGIWDLVRPLILKPLAALAESVGAWPLLCAVMGKNPITGEKVDSSADALIGGFMHLIGQDEIYTNIKKANAGARALAWFKTAMSGMVALVSSIPDRFMALVKSFEWSDILDLPSGFRKVASAFGSFAKDFFTWAGTTIWDLLQIIFEVVAPAVMPYLQKLGASFKSILKNPMGFVRNLVAAGKLGFQMFWQRFGEHLKKGFIEWLTGSMPGIYIPKAFTLEEIVKFVLSVLGLTWANIRGKLVKVVGETAVVAMEKGFAIVQTLVKDGPAAAWEQIKGELGNLRDLVFQSVMSFLVETVITKAVEKLASLLVPAAAFIQAILSIYNTIMVFVQKLAKIIQVVKAFLDGMMEIAAGSIGGAAAKVESTLAGLLALSINFLAGFLGLNNVAAKVMGIINDKVRAPIDKALDKAIAWIVAMAKKLFASGKAAVAGAIGWWKQKLSLTADDGEAHSLYFSGEGASARLMVASAPMELRAFLASKAEDAAKDPAKAAALRAIEPYMAKLEALDKLPQDQQQAQDAVFRATFNAIGPQLTILLGGGNWGTEANPVGIDYTKRPASSYPVIYCGPKCENRIPQDLLAARKIAEIEKLLTPAELAAWGPAKPIVAYPPTPPKPLPDGSGPVGIAPTYQIAVGKKILYKPGSTEGGGLINRTFRPYGYRAQTEGKDGDHVVEMQLGGPNILPNLWPLDASENRSSGSLLSRLTVKPAGRTMTLQQAHAARNNQLWIIITKTL